MKIEMLFSEVDDCEVCPFYKDNASNYESAYVCSADPNAGHPCEWMEDYAGMTLQEVVDVENKKIYAAE